MLKDLADVALQLNQQQLVLVLLATAMITTAIVATAFAMLRKRERILISKLNTAKADILFLLEVERRHCEIHLETTQSTQKNLVRRNVKMTTTLEWSGKNVPSRISTPSTLSAVVEN